MSETDHTDDSTDTDRTDTAHTAVDRTVHLPVAAQPSVETLVDISKEAEALGYERVWLPETWGRDAVTALTRIATETDDIGVGTSIVNVYSRSPALLAQTAATLQEVADGRFRLGIGPSGPAVIEGWHGESFERPLRRTREYIDIIKTVLAGEQLDYDGDIFTLGGFRLRSDPPDPVPPVDAAGMGPKSVELAGRFADGWHATVFTPDGLRDRLEDFRRGVDLGDRDRSALRTSLSLTACVLEDTERARDLAAGHAAFYVGAMGTYYRDSLARQGYEDLANDIALAWANGNREEATALAREELLDDLSAAGSPATARDALDRFAAVDGLDEIALGFPRGADVDDARETLRALAPESS